MGKKLSCVVVLAMVASCIPAGSARADITTGLAGYWPLDGDAQDASGNGHHGKINGDVAAVADRQGSPASAMRFPGQTSAHIDLGQPAGLLIKGAMTVGAWVRADTLSQTGRVIAKQGPSSGRSWGLNLESAGHARFDLGTTPTERVRADSAVLSFGPNEWFHMAGVYRPGEAVELYINGELAGSQPTTVTEQWIENNLPVNIGRRPEPGTPWRGDVDEARIYARALSAADMKELFAFKPAPRVKAWSPQPADGTVGVDIPLLQWKPGMTAVLHDVYLGTSPELGPADLVSSRLTGTTYYHVAGLQPGTTYFWRVDEIELDMTTVHEGDVWSFLTQALTAYHPTPEDGNGNVAPTVTLAWMPGRNALKHHVYLGDSFEAVSNGTAGADKGESTGTTFQPMDLLEATTYFWRVDEVLIDGTSAAGAVWSFSTFLTIDDFESYNDDEGKGTRIYETWLDGLTNDNGSVVGNWDPPFAEQKIIHGGRQSMPLDYNNVLSPFYSEAQREFAPAQDWTVNDANTLVLYVQGRPSNGPVQLYVAVEDTAQHRGIVSYPEPAVVATARWIEWQIPFSEFTAAGVNLARVRKMYIGLGDRDNPTAGGKGLIYIDDIRAIKAVATP